MSILVATRERLLRVDPRPGDVRPTGGIRSRPTCLTAETGSGGRAWCGTVDGIYRSDDGGATWTADGLEGEEVTAIAAAPTEAGSAWAGTEPSAVYRRSEGGRSASGPGGGDGKHHPGPEWRRADGLRELPSSSDWSFPPRPETHHVRWIACHPHEADRLWVAIEAGALVRTPDGGATWMDRVPGGPYDTHEIAIHPERPEALRIAAGDGYFESHDGGDTWRSPEEGLGVSYLRSVAIDAGDPDVVVVSAASRARSAYTAGRSDGRLYRRARQEPWQQVTDGWPEEPETMAPLLAAGREPGELWATDERGVHRSADGGRSWNVAAGFEDTPRNLRGLAVLEP